MPYEIHEDKIVMRAEQYNLPKPWQGLTDEEVQDFVSALWPVGVGAGKLLRAIEAKLKEKNNG
jgi:hypothetical protein